MSEPKIPIEVSARHIHLSEHFVELLFGEGYELTPEKYLTQSGTYLCKERLSIVGSRDIIHNVAILGPTRKYNQVEISMTDARKIGVDASIRESGHHDGSASCRLVGPAGEHELDSGVIIAKRHLHCNPSDAKRLGLNDGDIISIETKESLRPVIFEDVLVRVQDNFILTLHLDTDEGNAAGLTPDSYGVIYSKKS